MIVEADSPQLESRLYADRTTPTSPATPELRADKALRL
jgi:hypothetical protein